MKTVFSCVLSCALCAAPAFPAGPALQEAAALALFLRRSASVEDAQISLASAYDARDRVPPGAPPISHGTGRRAAALGTPKDLRPHPAGGRGSGISACPANLAGSLLRAVFLRALLNAAWGGAWTGESLLRAWAP